MLEEEEMGVAATGLAEKMGVEELGVWWARAEETVAEVEAPQAKEIRGLLAEGTVEWVAPKAVAKVVVEETVAKQEVAMEAEMAAVAEVASGVTMGEVRVVARVVVV